MRIIILSLFYLLIITKSNGQQVRLPIDFFELIPREALFILNGEGVVNFRHIGNYTIITKDTLIPYYRIVLVECNNDSIFINEIEKMDTTQITLIQNLGKGLTISCRVNSKKDDVVKLEYRDNVPIIYYNGKSKLEFKDNTWMSCEDEELFSIFGYSKLENSIYYGIIEDSKSFLGFFKRKVIIEDDSVILIKERRGIFRMTLKHDNRYSLVKTKNNLTFRNEILELRMSVPPLIEDGYEINLRLRDVVDRVLIY
jgi:hypothetical protein